MARVFLQPAAGTIPQKHYADTIQQMVPLSRMSRCLSAVEREKLETLYPEGRARVWGATPGPRNLGTWESMRPGDLVLFYAKGVYESVLPITQTLRSRALALDLWGQDEETGRTWELIFFLGRLHPIRIQHTDLHDVAPVGPKEMLRGLTGLSERMSSDLMSAFDLVLPSQVETPPPRHSGPVGHASTTEPQVPNLGHYEGAILQLDELDAKREAAVRKEQGFLRRMLFGSAAVGACALCGREFSIDLLVAAHIKRRSACNDTEKRDYKNNVMPMCRFGCDDLFERGYLKVVHGKVVEGPRTARTEAVRARVSWLRGKPCSYWSESRAPYFKWHAAHTAGEVSETS